MNNRVNWHMIGLLAGGILVITAGVILVLASTPGYAEVVSQGDVIGGALVVLGVLMILAWATASAIVNGLTDDVEETRTAVRHPRSISSGTYDGPRLDFERPSSGSRSSIPPFDVTHSLRE